MEPLKCNYNKWLITLAVITLTVITLTVISHSNEMKITNSDVGETLICDVASS